MMLTVPQAAERVGRNPETIRRWIREGRLRARKIGTQHVIEERDLDGASPGSGPAIEIPAAWSRSSDGSPQPDWEKLVRAQRDAH
jgi:excisionase family DNA binding protein